MVTTPQITSLLGFSFVTVLNRTGQPLPKYSRLVHTAEVAGCKLDAAPSGSHMTWIKVR